MQPFPRTDENKWGRFKQRGNTGFFLFYLHWLNMPKTFICGYNVFFLDCLYNISIFVFILIKIF